MISDSDTDLEVAQDDASQVNIVCIIAYVQLLECLKEIDTALEEFRRIRAEQDKEFADSLQANRKKVNS